MSAASGEPEVIRCYLCPGLDAGEALATVQPMHDSRAVVIMDATAYDRLAQQRDAAVQNVLAMQLARDTEMKNLRARLAACERDAARYQWLKARLLGADFEYEGTVPPSSVLTFKIPDTMRVSGNLDATIDDALTTDDDFGPNDGHARTVRRTPPQDAATTRGEG